jgi:hypothetical protein
MVVNGLLKGIGENAVDVAAMAKRARAEIVCLVIVVDLYYKLETVFFSFLFEIVSAVGITFTHSTFFPTS